MMKMINIELFAYIECCLALNVAKSNVAKSCAFRSCLHITFQSEEIDKPVQIRLQLIHSHTNETIDMALGQEHMLLISAIFSRQFLSFSFAIHRCISNLIIGYAFMLVSKEECLYQQNCLLLDLVNAIHWAYMHFNKFTWH